METHRAFAEAATWLANLHRDVTAGLVGDEVHDMLDRTPDRTDRNEYVLQRSQGGEQMK